MLTNPVGLPAEAAKQVADALNVDLASLYTLYHQVKKHHWLVEGPNFRDLHLMLDEMAGRLLVRADEVAERITALGGYPVSTPAEQQKQACFAPEPEGELPLRTMLENDHQAYLAVCTELRRHVELAREEGDFGTAHLLMETLLAVETDLHHLHHVLAPQTL